MQDHRMWEAEFSHKPSGTLGPAGAAVLDQVALGVTQMHPSVMHV